MVLPNIARTVDATQLNSNQLNSTQLNSTQLSVPIAYLHSPLPSLIKVSEWGQGIVLQRTITHCVQTYFRVEVCYDLEKPLP